MCKEHRAPKVKEVYYESLKRVFPDVFDLGEFILFDPAYIFSSTHATIFKKNEQAAGSNFSGERQRLNFKASTIPIPMTSTTFRNSHDK